MRNAVLAVAAAALGALAVILPAAAGSEASPTVNAVNGAGPYGEPHSWSPSSVSVAAGGSVTVANPTTISHGVRWVSAPVTPACSGGVPVGTTAAASGTEWSGSCTFAQPGTYTFYCTVHGAAMSATITVASPGGEAPSTPTTTSSGSPSSGSPSSSGGQGPGAAGGQAPSIPGAGSGSSASPFAGGDQALRLPASERGTSVRGTVRVSMAGAGGALEIDLLAKVASLARRGGATEFGVGKLERGVRSAGAVSFAVPLSERGKRALRRRGRLALTVEATLTPRGGRAAKLGRRVLLRPSLGR